MGAADFVSRPSLWVVAEQRRRVAGEFRPAPVFRAAASEKKIQ